jgi:hypothetical protein
MLNAKRSDLIINKHSELAVKPMYYESYEKNLKNLKNQKRVSALSRYPLDNYLCCFFVELVEKSLVSDAVCPYLKFLREEF